MDESHMDFSDHLGSADASGNDMMNLDDWLPQQPGLDSDMPSFYNDFSLDKPSFFNNADRLAVFSTPNTQRGPPTAAEKQHQPQTHERNPSQWRERGPSNPSEPQAPLYQDSLMSWDSLFASHPGNLEGHSPRPTNPQAPKDDDDDAASCDSACDRSCPSQCGEMGHGMVCDSDDCVPPGLCDDQDCFAASHPCTDEDCVGEMCTGETCEGNACKGDTCRFEPPSRQPAARPPVTEKDKAAAAALASFGDGQLPSGHSMSQLSHFGQVSSDLGCHGHLPVPGNFSGLPMGMPFMTFDHGQNCAWPPSAEHFLASHILQYHNPENHLSHHRPCVADHPSQLVSKCSLPRFYPSNDNHANFANSFAPQSQQDECGFLVQDPNDFTNHIFQEHREVLTNHCLHLSQLSTTQPQGSSSTCGQHFGYAHGGVCRPDTALATNRTSSGSVPPSPLTSLSMENTTTATPASPVTPSSAKEPTPSISGADMAIKAEERGSQSIPTIKSQAVETICRWVLPGGTKICGQEFQTEEALHSHCKECHLRTVERSEGGFNCLWEGCIRDKNFPQRSKLDRHLQTHTLYKPAQCPECGQWLSAQQALTQHMRTHTGLEPWRCPWEGCNSTFKQQSALTMHLRAHTGEKPLECEICGKRFSESSNLSKHRRIHNRKGQHMCGICGKDFHRLDQLRRHLGSNHKDQPAEANKLLCKAEEEGRGRGKGAGRGLRKSEESC